MASLFRRPQSILRNPSPSDSPAPFPLSLPSSPSLFPVALSSSSSSTDEELPQKHLRSSSVPGNSRRIRFAPLPIPVPNSDCVLLEPDILPNDPSPTAGCSQDSFSSEPTQKQIQPVESHTSSSSQLTPLASFRSHSSLPPSPTSMKKQSLFSRRILKPLFSPWNRSPPSGYSEDDILRRVSSRESVQSARGRANSKPNDNEFGSPLSRWESSSSVSSYVSDSGRSFSRRPKSASFSSSFSSLNPLSRVQSTPAPKHPSAKPGMRMLNGRVYGRRRPYSQSSINPFANVQSQEPEFVEWGYGGMGSNKTNENTGVGGRWKNVQGDGNTSAFGGTRVAAGDEDDASGMAWVKRRREMREKQRREEEEEKKKQLAISKDNSGVDSTGAQELADTTTPKDQPIADGEKTPKLESNSISSSPLFESFPNPTSSPPPDSSEHIYTSVTLPPATHKNHHHSHKRSLSSSRLQPLVIQTPGGEDPQGLDLGVLDPNLEAIVMSNDALEGVDGKINHVKDITDREESNGSTSEEDSSITDDDDDDDDDESDSDSESEDEEAVRKTALGAGVEKVSRHKDHQEPRTVVNSVPNTPGTEP